MIKKFLVLMLIIQANLLVAVDKEPEIFDEIKRGVDFSNLTPAQRAQFLPQVNAKSPFWKSPLIHCVYSGNEKAVSWLLTNGATVDDGDILEIALSPSSIVNPSIVEMLLLQGVPTNIEIQGEKPIVYMENKIKRWQEFAQRHNGFGDAVALYIKTHDILRCHELKLRMTWIRGLVQMGRPATSDVRGHAPVVRADRARVEVVSEKPHA